MRSSQNVVHVVLEAPFLARKKSLLGDRLMHSLETTLLADGAGPMQSVELGHAMARL